MHSLLKVTTYILNAKNHLIQYGFLSFLKTLLNHLGFKYFDRSLIFFVCNLDTLDTLCKGVNCKKQDLSLIALSVDDIESERFDYNDGFFSRHTAIYRLKIGHSLYALRLNTGKLASYVWVEQTNGKCSGGSLNP